MFQFSLPYREAIKIAKKLAHSMSTEETRYYLNGFFMHKADDGKHYAVSTDGHMLTRIDVQLAGDYEGEFPAVILPAQAVKQIQQIKLKVNEKQTNFVTFRVETEGEKALQHRYEIECNGQGFTGKLVDGKYPDYQRVIPPDWKNYKNSYGQPHTSGYSGFSALYLAKVMKAAAYDAHQFKETCNPAVQFLFDGTNPAVVTEVRDPRVLYVIMPMRV